MASLALADAVTRVLDALGREASDAQFPSTVIERKLIAEYRILRRRLAADFPALYERLSSETTLTTTTTITKPTGCGSVRVLEKKSGSGWYPVPLTNSLNRSETIGLAFYEMGDTIYITPASTAPGTYRIFYTEEPGATVTALDLPYGLEEVVIQEVAAFGRDRHNEVEHIRFHKDEARRIWDDAWMPLWKQANSGSHARSAMKIVR